MTNSSPATLCFGEYCLDADRRELHQGNQLVALEPKTFDLLAYLVTHRERAVSKEELQTALWPDVIVAESSLTHCVMKARRAVGDYADQQAVIKTVFGHGYRFVAEVQGAGDAADVVAALQALEIAGLVEQSSGLFMRSV